MIDADQAGVRAADETLRVRPSVASSAEWDAFAQRSGASFRCGYHAARAWQFEHHRVFRLRRLDVLHVDVAGRSQKIGQCAVGVGRRVRVFADAIQLLPEASAHWPAAMSAVAAALGAGTYVYGSEWTLAAPRETDLARMPGVHVLEVAPTRVMTIDLARWATFDDYLRAVSTNVRRNAKKAERSYARLRVDVRRGSGGLANFARALLLRRSLFARKGLRRSTLGMALRSAARLASLREFSESASLYDGDALIASHGGVRFGRQFAYIEGASAPDGKGGAWYLHLAMIRRAFEASGGAGRYVMGSDDGSQGGDAWDGLRRSRTQCCAEPIATSVVRFAYAPPAAAAAEDASPQAIARRRAAGPAIRLHSPRPQPEPT